MLMWLQDAKRSHGSLSRFIIPELSGNTTSLRVAPSDRLATAFAMNLPESPIEKAVFKLVSTYE